MAEWSVPEAARRGGGGLPWIAGLTLFVLGSDLNLVAPFLSAIATTFHLPRPGRAGWLVTVFALSYTVTSPVWGYIQDRMRARRAVLGVGLGAFLVSEAVSAAAPTYGTLMAARALGGMAAAAVTPAAYAWIADWVPWQRRSRAMAVASMGFSVATVAGVPLGLWGSQWWSWRGVLWALTALGAMVGAAWVPYLRIGPVAARPPSGPSSPKAAGLPVLAASFFAFGTVGLVYTYLAWTFQHRFQWPVGRLALLLGLYGMLGVGGNALMGWLGDRWGKRAAARRAMVAEGLSLLGMAVAASGRLGGALAAAVLGFGLTQAYLPNLKAMASAVSPGRRGQSVAWNNAAMYAGLMVGSGVATVVVPRWGLAWAAGMGVLALTAGWTVLGRPYRGRHEAGGSPGLRR